MIIKYEFIDGKKIEIAVSTELGQVILQFDKEAKNKDKRETRRHQSLSEVQNKSDMLIDKNVNIEENFLKRVEVDKLYEAISKLKPAEQKLIHKLYLDKHPMTQVEYARRKDISKVAMWKKVQRIRVSGFSRNINELRALCKIFAQYSCYLPWF